MRFEIGQDYYFARILFTAAKQGWSTLFRPWEDELQKIEFLKLTCIEHHKVAWDQDPDAVKNNDGFIFRDAEGNRWANQYPTACYGQLDDSHDRMVRRYFETEELLEVDSAGKVVKDEDGKAKIKDKTKWAIFDDQFTNPYTLATQIVDTQVRGVEILNYSLPKEAEALVKFNERFVEELEAFSSCKVVRKALLLRSGKSSTVTVAKLEPAAV